ncbi:MAG TPA: SDR family oxidoreductase [Bacteroidales bacterium]|nr:SDR family oxidoreductase [Bacteroidales bacterium]
MSKTVLITGATSGIGEATASRFAKEGYNLVITGRRAERLDVLAAKLVENHGVKVLTLCFDIRKREEVESTIGSLTGEWRTIDVLVNNTGLAAGLDPIQQGSIDDWEQMIDTNIKGLLYVTRLVAPMMIEKRNGHIINIGSIAGKEVYAKGNVYCATKFAVDALTKAMRIDMLQHGIRVSQVCPGAVETEFSEVRFKGDKQTAANVYKGYTPLTADDIAEAIWWIAARPAHVNINDLVIMPASQASPHYHHKDLL